MILSPILQNIFKYSSNTRLVCNVCCTRGGGGGWCRVCDGGAAQLEQTRGGWHPDTGGYNCVGCQEREMYQDLAPTIKPLITRPGQWTTGGLHGSQANQTLPRSAFTEMIKLPSCQNLKIIDWNSCVCPKVHFWLDEVEFKVSLTHLDIWVNMGHNFTTINFFCLTRTYSPSTQINFKRTITNETLKRNFVLSDNICNWTFYGVVKVPNSLNSNPHS